MVYYGDFPTQNPIRVDESYSSRTEIEQPIPQAPKPIKKRRKNMTKKERMMQYGGLRK